MCDVRILIWRNGASTGIRWSTVQLNLRWVRAPMRRHRRLVKGAARMGDHNGRTSPARCCTSVTDSFQDGSSACCVPRLLFPCIRQAALIMPALTHSTVRLGETASLRSVCLSACLSLQTHTVTRGNATAILSPAQSVTLLTSDTRFYLVKVSR